MHFTKVSKQKTWIEEKNLSKKNLTLCKLAVFTVSAKQSMSGTCVELKFKIQGMWQLHSFLFPTKLHKYINPVLAVSHKRSKLTWKPL